MPRPPDLDPATAAEWAGKAQVYSLDALMAETSWRVRDVAFHGGTSLHLSWRSPRHSEDLDFLLARDVEGLPRIMARVARAVQERFVLEDPTISIELRDMTRDAERLPNWKLTIASTARTGKAMVKVEFLRVDRDYIAKYRTEFRTPTRPGDLVSTVTNPVPAATLATAFADKLVAFATRPHLKWRDVFDLWWIGTQTRAQLDVAEVSDLFLRNLTAFEVRGGALPSQALRDFLDRPEAEVTCAALKDLRPWLPPSLWDRLWPDEVARMVSYVRAALAAVADHVDGGPAPEDPDTLKRAP